MLLLLFAFDIASAKACEFTVHMHELYDSIIYRPGACSVVCCRPYESIFTQNLHRELRKEATLDTLVRYGRSRSFMLIEIDMNKNPVCNFIY